jgi:hypothetical protein
MGTDSRYVTDSDLAGQSALSVGVNAGYIPQAGIINAHVAAGAAIAGSKLATKAKKHFARSQVFDIDNGSGITVDDVIIRPSVAITILAARVVYVDATSGTVAAGTVKVGKSVGDTAIVDATNLENGKAVGTATALTLVDGTVAATVPVCVRHTGIAATAAGKYYVEIEFTIDD